MTAPPPAQDRGYLTGQRRMIIARAIAGSLTAAVPVPFLDDRALTAVLGGGYRRIAAAYDIALHPAAQLILVHGPAQPPSLAEIAGGEVAYRIAGPAARWAMIAFAVVGRAQSASRTFVTLTLFHHYCARLHTGRVIDAATARALHQEIDRAIDQVPGGLEFHPFRRTALSAAGAARQPARRLGDITALRALGRAPFLRGRATPTALTDADQVVETELAHLRGLLSRIVAAVESQLSAEANPFLDRAIDALDRSWRVRVAAGIR